jgi:putative membrane protein
MTPDPSPQDRQIQLAEQRTRTALYRTLLAEQRTYSAWVRTGLASAAAGLGVIKLLGDVQPIWLVDALGTLFVAAGGSMFALGFWAYLSGVRRLEQPPAGGVPVWVLGALSLALLVGTIAALWLVFQN